MYPFRQYLCHFVSSLSETDKLDMGRLYRVAEMAARAGGLRDITREAVRARISEVAIGMFAEHGFDEVTVEEVAAAVGISARSFHRYFPAKEDAVLGDSRPWGEYVRDALAARPPGESAWASLRAAFESLLALSDRHGEQQKRTMRVLGSTASLRARNLEKHLLWEQMLTPLVAERMTGGDTALRARAIVQSALACFDTALTAWAEPGETRSPAELLAISFAALQPAS